jgi:thioredoxin-like negative regulator of GroEL
MNMLERILVLGIVVILITIFQKKFSTGKKIIDLHLPGNISVPDSSLPTVIYFWTDECIQCKISQKPALNSLKDKTKDFNLINVNALERNDLTLFFNIRTVPSTIIFSNDGKSRFVNNGYANRDELARQISLAMEA